MGPFSTDLFWGPSVACALVAEALAKETGHAKPGAAFTAGILHDIGRLVMAQFEPATFGQVLYRALQRQKHIWEAEDEQFGFHHAALGAELARRWNFPTELTTAIAEHHDLQHAADRSVLTYVSGPSERCLPPAQVVVWLGHGERGQGAPGTPGRHGERPNLRQYPELGREPGRDWDAGAGVPAAIAGPGRGLVQPGGGHPGGGGRRSGLPGTGRGGVAHETAGRTGPWARTRKPAQAGLSRPPEHRKRHPNICSVTESDLCSVQEPA